MFVDAGHNEADVRKDIEAWLPKVKNSGILFGDDWLFDSVKKGVLAEFGPERVSESINGYLWSVKKDESNLRADQRRASPEPDVSERAFAKEA